MPEEKNFRSDFRLDFHFPKNIATEKLKIRGSKYMH